MFESDLRAELIAHITAAHRATLLAYGANPYFAAYITERNHIFTQTLATLDQTHTASALLDIHTKFVREDKGFNNGQAWG